MSEQSITAGEILPPEAEILDSQVQNSGTSDVTVEKHSNLKPWKKGQSGNPAGRPRGARSLLGEAFIQDLAEDYAESGKDVFKQLRMRNVAKYVDVIVGLLPKEIVLAKFDIKVPGGKDEDDFSDKATVDGILESVAREAGGESARALADMFGLEYNPIETEAEVEAKVDVETAMQYGQRKR